MKIIKGNNPLLSTVCQKVDFNNPPFDLVEFAQELVKLMRDNGGIGLAANQVGEPYRIFAMRTDPNTVCINPRIVMPGDEIVQLEEGCLSFPGMLVKVKRPKTIRVRYEELNGETITKTFTGVAARVFQHELDHLDGILFYDKANKFHRDQALRRFKNAERQQAREDKKPKVRPLGVFLG